MSIEMNVEKILSILPHRFPFLLVDRVLEFEQDKTLLAIKNVTANEHFFVGHFPQRAVMPGVLIVEALAQASAILAYHSTTEEERQNDSIFYLGSVDARFRKVVTPGDQLLLHVEVLKRKAQVWKFKGVATVSGKIACVTEMTSAGGGIQA